jgi:putative flippase GtrA
LPSYEIIAAVVALILGSTAYRLHAKRRRTQPSADGSKPPGPPPERGNSPPLETTAPTYSVVQEGPEVSGPRFRMYMRTELVGYIINEALLVALTSAGIYYLYSSAITLVTLHVSKFFLNYLGTFNDRQSGRRASRFVKSSILGLAGIALHLGILYLATNDLLIPYAISNLIAIAVTMPLYFVVNFRYVWAKGSTEVATSLIPRSAS